MKRLFDFISQRPLLALGMVFTLSRAVLYTLFPFRIGFLPMLNQLLDINLLRTDLWSSLWQLHATPPLYNLFVAAVLNAAPEPLWPLLFQSVYFVLALGIVLLSYRILIFLRVPQHWALISGIVIALNPVLFRFEIIPFYTIPLAFLILLSVFLLTKFIETNRQQYLLLFLAVPLVILLFRNFFHVLVFYIPIIVGACVLAYTTQKSAFKNILVASLIFLAIGLAPNIKNYVEYGVFSSSTWQGMQLFSMTYFVPKEDIKELVEEGAVTPLALLPRFQNADIYYEYYQEPLRSGNPVLNAMYKSTEGRDGNFNNWIYVQTAKEYGENTFAILSRYPEYFVPRFINSVYIFFGVANYRYFDKTEEWLIFNGDILHRAFQFTKYAIQPAVFAGVYVLVVWFLIKNLWLAYRSKQMNRGNNPLLLYSLFLLAYIFGVANVVELGENYTARLPIDPLLLILFIYAVWYTYKKKHGNVKP